MVSMMQVEDILTRLEKNFDTMSSQVLEKRQLGPLCGEAA